MKVDIRQEDDILVLALDGRLVAGTGDAVLRDTMNKVIADGWTKILIDMSKIERIDSAGIGELMASRKLARTFQSEIRLLNVEGQVEHILSIGQLLPLFQVYETEAEALAAFAD